MVETYAPRDNADEVDKVVILAESVAAAPLGQAGALMFYGLAALTLITAWAVVISQNIIRMSIYLLLTLGGVAGFYFMMNAEFLAAIQLIVYAGGTLILIIFGVMLTSKNPFLDLKAKGWERFVGVGLGAAIAGLLLFALVSTQIPTLSPSALPNESTVIDNPVTTVGRALLTDYIVPFEVAAILLLVVMIGAAYMARRRS